MWGSGVYYDQYSSGFDSYGYPVEYDEGYGEEEDYNICTPTAPRCWNGSNCPFFATGTCQYYHPPEDHLEEGEEEAEEEAQEEEDQEQEPLEPPPLTPSPEEPKTAPGPSAVGLGARPWNVLINPAVTPPAKADAGLLPGAEESPGKAKVQLRARLRSRSSRRKSLESPRDKDDIIAQAKRMLAEKRREKYQVEAAKYREVENTSSAALPNAPTAAMKGA